MDTEQSTTQYLTWKLRNSRRRHDLRFLLWRIVAVSKTADLSLRFFLPLWSQRLAHRELALHPEERPGGCFQHKVAGKFSERFPRPSSLFSPGVLEALLVLYFSLVREKVLGFFISRISSFHKVTEAEPASLQSRHEKERLTCLCQNGKIPANFRKKAPAKSKTLQAYYVCSLNTPFWASLQGGAFNGEKLGVAIGEWR